MKLIEPKVELLSELDISPESHIARCARVCYGFEYKEPNQEADEKMVRGLNKRNHLSMLRHASRYGVVSDMAPSWWSESPYCTAAGAYLSTNEQFFVENQQYFDVELYPSDMLQECVRNPLLFNIFRLTFCITTQISTSRELNRVSPNAIAERSTRFCILTDGLEIVKPCWWDDVNRRIDKIRYEGAVNQAELCYRYMIDNGMKPEDARGILPLDTATKVIYTYSVQEWKHIIDLRYYGTTGKPHPNAKLVIGMVREQINQFAKEHNIDFQI